VAISHAADPDPAGVAVCSNKEMPQLVVLHTFSVTEDGTDLDCCSLREANAKGRVLHISLIVAIMAVTEASPISVSWHSITLPWTSVAQIVVNGQTDGDQTGQ
jgi:hypothetical protein